MRWRAKHEKTGYEHRTPVTDEANRGARPHRRPAPPPVARTRDPSAGRLRLCPRGTARLVRGQRRGLRHRPGQELAAHGQDRPGAGQRGGGSVQTGPGRPPVYGVPVRDPDQLVAPAPRHRQGRASARQGQPPLRRHLSAPDRLGPDRLRARLLPPRPDGERHQGTASSICSPIGHPPPASPPTSSGSSSPPSPPSSSVRCGALCTAPGSPAPRPLRCASSSSRSERV